MCIILYTALKKLQNGTKKNINVTRFLCWHIMSVLDTNPFPKILFHSTRNPTKSGLVCVCLCLCGLTTSGGTLVARSWMAFPRMHREESTNTTPRTTHALQTDKQTERGVLGVCFSQKAISLPDLSWGSYVKLNQSNILNTLTLAAVTLFFQFLCLSLLQLNQNNLSFSCCSEDPNKCSKHPHINRYKWHWQWPLAVWQTRKGAHQPLWNIKEQLNNNNKKQSAINNKEHPYPVKICQ